MSADTGRRIVWFDAPEAKDSDLVGGKCRNLAELTAAGLPVPPGFVVSTRAYREALSATGLDGEIQRMLTSVDPTRPETAHATAQEIARLFSRQPLPPSLTEEIGSAYRTLCDRSGHAGGVAVRSSATAEDLAEASFAGQQDTFLNISGASRVIQAVRDCWDSLFSWRALTYRAKRLDRSPASLAMAVGVQALVPARVSGVLFTVNPHTGDPSQLMIEATWGLGEAIVSGLVTPDRYIMEKRTSRTIEMVVAQKTVRVVCGPGGTLHEPVPLHHQTLPCLTIADRELLASSATRVEEMLGPFQDIEWAIDASGQHFLLQARPVTARPPRESQPPAPAPPSPHHQALYRNLIWGSPTSSAVQRQ